MEADKENKDKEKKIEILDLEKKIIPINYKLDFEKYNRKMKLSYINQEVPGINVMKMFNKNTILFSFTRN